MRARLGFLGRLFRAVGVVGGLGWSATAGELWLYLAENLQVPARVERVEALFARAHAAGYTHVLLSDSKFSRLEQVPDFYFQHVARVRAAARSNQLTLVPAVFPVGYSNDLLSQDPDLAEGPPFRDVRFAVHDGVARPEPEPGRAVTLRGGDFADLRAWDWKDDTVQAEAGAAVIRDPRGANARIVQRLRVEPWHPYHLAVRVKTRDFHGEPEAKFLAAEGGRALNFASLGVQPTQDWRVHHVVFNSLQYTNIALYLGVWGGDTGELRFDDATLEEAGLVNLVRREGAPFTVRDVAGRELVEGTDFEPVRDPRMGRVQWPGDYDVFHEPPVIRMKAGIADGSVLRVSGQSVALIHEGQVMMDIAEPRALELLRRQAGLVHEHFQARGYFLSHDEIRVLGWSEAFRRRGRTPGELIGDNVRAGFECARALVPEARVLVWSDMFDPNHNAVAGPYYLVNGPLGGAWEGLDRSVVVMNWNHGRRDASLKFFADRGHRQVIAAYYDNPLRELDEWLVSTKEVPGVLGFMYTTWRGDYRQLEDFARRVRESGR